MATFGIEMDKRESYTYEDAMQIAQESAGLGYEVGKKMQKRNQNKVFIQDAAFAVGIVGGIYLYKKYKDKINKKIKKLKGEA